MKKRNVLYIAPVAPLAGSPHAGGQLAHYYVDKLNKNPAIALKMLCYLPQSEIGLTQFADEGFDATYFFLENESIVRKLYNRFDFNSYGFIARRAITTIKRILCDLKKTGYAPDYVIFDWEQSSFLYSRIKTIWKHARYVVVEQDVLSQSLYRFYKNEKNLLFKVYRFYSYITCTLLEKRVFSGIDEIVVLSHKDKVLIENLGISSSKIRMIAPYFHDYEFVDINPVCDKTVVFLGYYKRIENVEAVEWFVKTVLPLIPDCSLIIIGGGVSDSIQRLASDRVKITGFVSHAQIAKYFEESLCLVAPLFHGAGVKIKVLEAMLAGVPVLTNHIGIEGIDAADRIEYFHCESAEDYARSINDLSRIVGLREQIGNNARLFINNHFDYRKSSYIETGALANEHAYIVDMPFDQFKTTLK